MKPLRPMSYWRRHQLQKCECGGYHFPHRRTGGTCHHGPRSDFHLALRAGVSRKEAMLLLSVAQLEALFPLSS